MTYLRVRQRLAVGHAVIALAIGHILHVVDEFQRVPGVAHGAVGLDVRQVPRHAVGAVGLPIECAKSVKW